MENYIYVFGVYEFYEGSTILMVSYNYKKLERYFNRYKIGNGQGLYIKRYECDKLLTYKDKKVIKRLEIDYDGKVKELDIP